MKTVADRKLQRQLREAKERDLTRAALTYDPSYAQFLRKVEDVDVEMGTIEDAEELMALEN